MPFVNIDTSSGPFSFSYTIATPSSESTAHIVPQLPTVLFLHSGYVSSEVFEFQFSDRHLREFNLIAIDMRGYGLTKGEIGDAKYTPTESAQDVDQILAKLNLPPCHVFGLSNGCNTALELTGLSPDKILSLTLCSPLSAEELEDVAAGRLEVFHYWEKMCSNTTASQSSREEFDQEMAEEVLNGASQLLYNLDKSHSHAEAVLAHALRVSQRIWAGTPEKIKQSHKTAIEWFLKRRAVPSDLLAKIKVPVHIIHCREDIAYSIDHANELTERLEEAGVQDVTLHQLPGAHYGNLTDPKSINSLLYDTVIACHPTPIEKPEITAPTTPGGILLTPFTSMLMENSQFDPEDVSD
ncbi:alpha/beta-hydrolase [Pholiota conissans]|uniref:Alpha/beta-hydrolase n=1 Tax=Pholiota conissans TaxID=109636 RepID=A0A9P5Z9N0_9AGAR|nr:alpha/beta-hydrolase [Pholiota conissans]